MKSTKTENLFIAIGFPECMCKSVIITDRKQILEGKFKFGILNTLHIEVLLETCYESQSSSECENTCKRIQLNYSLWLKFNFSESYCISIEHFFFTGLSGMYHINANICFGPTCRHNYVVFPHGSQ